MSSVIHYKTKLVPGNFFHLYGRSTGKEMIFRSERNATYFIEKMKQYLDEVMEFYAYAIMGNHYHVLVRVRPNIPETEEGIKRVHHQVQRWLQTFGMAYNKENSRVGSLFQRPFKRALIESEDYLQQVVMYIHTNPQHHGVVDDFRKYRWTSYHTILHSKPTVIQREMVLSWFGGEQGFREMHGMKQRKIERDLMLED